MSHAASQYVKHLVVAPNGEKLTPTEKAVLGQLADDHNEEHRFAWPSVGNLAKRACMTEVHCRRLLRSLEKKGVLESTANLRENGGRSSNRYRFPQIDPPFDRKHLATTAKVMQMQEAQRAAQPQQMDLTPPNTHVRGGQTPMLEGGEHGSSGGANTHVGGGRTPMFAPEPLLEASGDLSLEAGADPQTPPLPPQGGEKNRSSGSKKAMDQDRWNDLKVMLKSELYSIPGNLAAAKQFKTVQPSPGAVPQSDGNDYDVCFRDWWLVDARRLPNGLLLLTGATDEAATEQGIAKYAARLTRLARRYFEWPDKAVNFKVETAGVIPAMAATAATTERETPAEVFAFDDDVDVWEQAKVAIEREIEQLRGREHEEARANFDAAIRPVRFVASDKGVAGHVWKLLSPNAKKTRAVLALLRKQVSPALRFIAGGEVELLVMQQTS